MGFVCFSRILSFGLYCSHLFISNYLLGLSTRANYVNACADYVTETLENDGVALAIEKLILTEPVTAR